METRPSAMNGDLGFDSRAISKFQKDYVIMNIYISAYVICLDHLDTP
jgi:hypothetical protein